MKTVMSDLINQDDWQFSSLVFDNSVWFSTKFRGIWGKIIKIPSEIIIYPDFPSLGSNNVTILELS
jgi:hypothetical protein